MNLIEKVGGQGMAEIILSLATTSAILPNCYFSEFKQYGHACEQSNTAYVFDDDECQYFPLMPLDQCKDQVVMLLELQKELRERDKEIEHKYEELLVSISN